MAYTDFLNVAAPSFWNEAQSGFLEVDWYTSSTTNLNTIKTRIEYPIASVWTGARYEPYGRGMLLQFPSPLTLDQLWVDMLDDNSYTGLWMYGPDDTLLFGGPRVSFDNPTLDITDEFGSLISRVYDFTAPVATPIKAVIIDDPNGFPQGRVGLLYGIYGTQLAGAPPPFWTGFNRTEERRFA